VKNVYLKMKRRVVKAEELVLTEQEARLKVEQEKERILSLLENSSSIEELLAAVTQEMNKNKK